MCQDSFWGLFPLGDCHGATSGLSLASESSGVGGLHIGYCRRRPWGVRRSSEARQASGTFLGREPRGAAAAATRGYGRVPLQGTCAWGVVRAGGSRFVIGRFHQPADAGPFAWTRGGAAASWHKFEDLSGPRCWDGMHRAHTTVARVPCTLTPSLSRVHPGAVDRMSFCGRGGTRAAGPRRRGTNLKICPGRAVGMECGVHTPRWRVPYTLTPSLSRVHPGAVHRMSFRGRGGTRAAGPRVSRRSDSPTDARSVGSALAKGVESRSGVSTSQLTLGRSPTRGGAAAS
jgi:hypothetical protein